MGLIFNPRMKPRLGTPLIKSHRLSKGLVACWLMNEGTGNKVYDLSGNRNTGTITGALWTPGKFGPCLSIAAGTNSVNCGNLSDRALGENMPMTISLWMYPTAFNYGMLFQKGSMYVYEETLNRLFFVVEGGTALLKSVIMAYEVWTHLVITWDGLPQETNVHFYLNGKEPIYDSGQNGASLTDNASADLLLGNYSTLNFDYLGLIDIPQIYNRALTASEVLQLYREPFCMFEPAI